MSEQEENGLFEMPDYEHVEDEIFPPFPPPASPERDPVEAEPDEDEGWKLGTLFIDQAGLKLRSSCLCFPSARIKESGSGAPVPVPPKRTVKRNLPKLDATRLTSERGLPALRHVFDNTKFKGKGHEAEDLKTLIRHMEHWAHRLFPKLQFEDFIDRVENLGNKKEVQTCLKRIRLDLPIVHEDFVNNNDEVEATNPLDVTAAGFDSFLTSSSDSKKLASESSRSLTEEQQQRIERNKQLALERRQAKLLSNSQSLENDELMSTSWAQPVEESSTGEEQEESGGLNTDAADGPHDVPSANTDEEEQLKAEDKQLNHTNLD
ncbi:TIMELESS-interacting protein isoform X2 [Peromyscus californicus insignis]|nr:TIMELESS-interacting protein isoform X2 [Peromyscus californicus insignis]XP_052568014.1 TIMELESS-interacting protein isoform X2 [Peromyscus californicus insignis]XP_052568024.1 TIMELESS-interacting protein isoform X2 [Peromyscus californicus insignis]XP_052568035.1 TIMELESS-interacting protein isoform X2 [Peromyscus californicus insignis]